MQWIRKVSLVRRVVIGFTVTSLMLAALGSSAIYALRTQQADWQRWVAAGAKAAAPETASGVVWLLGLATAGCLLFGLLAAWLIRASIKESVESTVDCVARIARGDLETKIESPGKDEISWLRHELNSMRKKLRTAVIEVRQTVEGVNTASREVASGNLDLSSRTESQAGVLQQTSASMQQLAGTVASNANSTQQARDEVVQSSAVASRGATTMKDVVTRMGEIHASATRIGEIVGVIDGIAFQTNILALNAAVEAARAGEHGRGFAVVASEVRALAHRSSTAAREIKTLISESTEKVESGSKLVNDAGQTMQEILASVNRTAQLIGDIAQAGSSQSSDIGQMNQAVAQIDVMTQQNAALVEELSAAAQSLTGQAGRLTEAISSFRVAA
jgi:methyl-accepting chemotaxis protein